MEVETAGRKYSQPTRHRAYRLRIFLFFTRASLVNQIEFEHLPVVARTVLTIPNEAGTILRIDALEVLYLVVADKEITGLWQGLHLVDWHDAVVQIEVDREGVHAVGFQHISAIRADGGRGGDGLLDDGGHTAVGLDLHNLRDVHAVEAQLQEENDAGEREEIGALVMAAIVDGQQSGHHHQQPTREPDGGGGKGLKEGTVFCRVVAEVDKSGLPTQTDGDEHGGEGEGQHGEGETEGAEHTGMAVAHPKQITRQEIGQEGIDGQQVDATLAGRNAVEHEDNGKRQEGESIDVAHASPSLNEARAKMGESGGFHIVPHLPEALHPQRHHEEQHEGEGQKARQDGHHIIGPGVDMGSIGHLSRKTQHVFFIDELQETRSAIGFVIGGPIPQAKRDEAEQGNDSKLPEEGEEAGLATRQHIERHHGTRQYDANGALGQGGTSQQEYHQPRQAACTMFGPMMAGHQGAHHESGEQEVDTAGHGRTVHLETGERDDGGDDASGGIVATREEAIGGQDNARSPQGRRQAARKFANAS